MRACPRGWGRSVGVEEVAVGSPGRYKVRSFWLENGKLAPSRGAILLERWGLQVMGPPARRGLSTSWLRLENAVEIYTLAGIITTF